MLEIPSSILLTITLLKEMSFGAIKSFEILLCGLYIFSLVEEISPPPTFSSVSFQVFLLYQTPISVYDISRKSSLFFSI